MTEQHEPYSGGEQPGDEQSKRLTKDEYRLLAELLDREIYDLCAYRLDPRKETYVGKSLHNEVVDRLRILVSARQKITTRLPERYNPLSLVIQGTRPAIGDLYLARLLGLTHQ